MATDKELEELKNFNFTPPSEILEDVEEFFDVDEDELLSVADAISILNFLAGL